MAKSVDETKIERIREAAIAVVVETGIPQSTVAAIASRAGVSVGYLYRHYKGKDELINDLVAINSELIYKKISSLMEERRDIGYIIDGGVRFLLNASRNYENKIRFLITLLHDFSNPLANELKEYNHFLASELLEMAAEDSNVREGICGADLFFALVGVPMQYLTLHYNGISGSREIPSDDHIVGVARNVILKNNFVEPQN